MTTADDNRDTAVTLPLSGAAPGPDRDDADRAGIRRPTVRWGALVWSLVFGGLAATTLWVVLEPGARNVLAAWLVQLTPLTALLTTLIAIGVLVAVFGVVALIRRGEHARD